MGATLRYHIEFGDKIIAVDGVGSSERTAKYNASEKVFLEIEPKNCLVLPA
jgi:predicted metalloprotease with PDZ domain